MVAMSESALRRNSGAYSHTPSRGSSRGASRRGGDDDVFREVKERAADVVQRLRSGTGAAKEQVMQKAAEVTRAVADGVREEAERFFDEQKGRLGNKVQGVGKMIHQAAHALHAVKADGVADAVDAAGERFERVSDYVKERGLGDLLADAEDAARRHPGLVAGGLFVAGLLAVRFVKASASREPVESNTSRSLTASRKKSPRSSDSGARRNGKAGRGR